MQNVDLEEFSIKVEYNKKAYYYKVVHQRISYDKELFQVIAAHRTVEIEADWQVLNRHGLNYIKRKYGYDQTDITNKTLIQKVINSIDKHLSANVPVLKRARAIAI